MNSTNKNTPPETARAVIIGGGIMGCALAYHLTKEGWRDIVLLEKAELTSGSTWHAAGQVTRATSSVTLGKCVNYNIELYSGKLADETGQQLDWHDCGSIRLAYSADEMDWLQHILSVAKSLKVDVELIDLDRIHQLHPYYNLSGVKGGIHTPDDGHIDPSSLTTAFAKGARQGGASIVVRCQATNIIRKLNGEWRVETEHGNVDCEHVINAAGTYARQIGEWNNLVLPMTSMTHHYFVTDTVPEFMDLSSELPVIRDDSMVSGYIRMEQKSGLIGIYEKQNPNTVWENHCPWDAEHELFEADYERVMPWLKNALDRVPIFENLGIKRVVHGAISHTPDGNPLIGPVFNTPNYWCCCGTQIGIGWGPALTRELARWMAHGSANFSMNEFDPRRFGSYASKKWQVIKAKEDYCLRHEIPFPYLNRLAGRPINKADPLYRKLKSKGAVFEEVFGHERPRWFAKFGVEPKDQDSFRRNVLHKIVGHEVSTVRSSVGVMDISAFAKVEVSGQQTNQLLDPLITSKLPYQPGRIILTYMLNRLGRIELELIVVCIDTNCYYLICTVFYLQRLLDNLRSNINVDQVQIEDLTNTWGALAIQGPRSRQLLESTLSVSFDNSNFPWFRAKILNVYGHKIYALRISYSGELGWEIHGSRSSIFEIYNKLWELERDFEMVDYGSFAMNVMRMEKGYKGARELNNEVTLAEADSMRLVNLATGDFVGKAATIHSANNELPWICIYLSFESNGVFDGHGGETVFANDEVVGSTTSVVYGHSVNCNLAFAFVDPIALQAGTRLEIMVAGEKRPAKLLPRAAYDPKNLRPKVGDSV